MQGRRVRRSDLTIATMDHNTPTRGGYQAADEISQRQMDTLTENCRWAGIQLHPMGSRHQGIVHIIGPQLGITQPGLIIVCGDSHTSTHGAFGTIAFGIGTSEVEHVLATQTLIQAPAKNMLIEVNGGLGAGVSPKDVILAIIGKIGTAGGTGHVFEYAGSTFRDMSMEGRMTVCNMSIEAGARAGFD